MLEELSAAGLEVRDDGDLPRQVWKPDRDHPLAQNADEAAAPLLRLSGRLEPLLARGDSALVLGGNCTIALGIMAALRRLGPAAPGLLYVDRHYEIRGYERCRSASSTRPAAPRTPPRYPVCQQRRPHTRRHDALGRQKRPPASRQGARSRFSIGNCQSRLGKL